MLTSCHGRAAAVVFFVVDMLVRGIGGGSGSAAAHHSQGQAACGVGGARHDDNEEVGECATAEVGNRGKIRGSARADNNQPKSDCKDVQNITWSR